MIHLQPKYHLPLKVLTFAVGIVLICSFVAHSWWWTASYYAFTGWYPHLGGVIWTAKFLFAFCWLVAMIYFMYMDLRKHVWSFPVFVCYVAIALILKNQHPFSNLAVYDSFPDTSFVFMIEDEKGRIFNHGLKYKSADLIDYYDTYTQQKKSGKPLSEKELSEIGHDILNIVKAQNQYTGESCFKLVRLTNFIKNGALKSEKSILYEACN